MLELRRFLLSNFELVRDVLGLRRDTVRTGACKECLKRRYCRELMRLLEEVNLPVRQRLGVPSFPLRL